MWVGQAAPDLIREGSLGYRLKTYTHSWFRHALHAFSLTSTFKQWTFPFCIGEVPKPLTLNWRSTPKVCVGPEVSHLSGGAFFPHPQTVGAAWHPQLVALWGGSPSRLSQLVRKACNIWDFLNLALPAYLTRFRFLHQHLRGIRALAPGVHVAPAPTL